MIWGKCIDSVMDVWLRLADSCESALHDSGARRLGGYRRSCLETDWMEACFLNWWQKRVLIGMMVHMLGLL